MAMPIDVSASVAVRLLLGSSVIGPAFDVRRPLAKSRRSRASAASIRMPCSSFSLWCAGLVPALPHVPDPGDCVDGEQSGDGGADGDVRALRGARCALRIVVDRLAERDFGGEQRQRGEARVLMDFCARVIARRCIRSRPDAPTPVAESSPAESCARTGSGRSDHEQGQSATGSASHSGGTEA